MSVTPIQFNSFTEAFDTIAKVRDHARADGTEQKLTITVAGKTYDIKAETTIKHREGQGIRNWLRKRHDIKETTISITERRKAGSVAQDPTSGQTVRLDSGTAETTSIKCIFDKGKGLKTELQKLDKKLNIQSNPAAQSLAASKSKTQRQTEKGVTDELKKRFDEKQKPLSSSTPSIGTPQTPQTPSLGKDETIMNDLQGSIPALQNMQDLRMNKLGTLKTQTDGLTTAINAKKSKSLNFQEINENAALIISQKAKLLRQANETLNNLNQTTYTGTSGTPHQTTDIKRILEKNITFNANSFKVELVRAQNIINITAAHTSGMSPKDLQAMNDRQNNMQKLFEFEQQFAAADGPMKSLLEEQINNLRQQVDLEQYTAMCQEIEKQYQALMTST
jgi:hypothetical protein